MTELTRNVFVIPSWYPNAEKRVAGIFTREQICALARYYPKFNFAVSTWGHDSTYLKLRQPFSIPRTLFASFRFATVKRVDNYWEFSSPIIHWSFRLPGRSLERLVSVNRKNLRQAIERFGHIDIIHAHVGFPAGYIAARLSAEFMIPFVITEHMGPFPFKNLINGDVLSDELIYAYKNAAGLIAVSPSQRERIASLGLGFPLVIPNCIDESIFRTTVAKPVGRGVPVVFFTLCHIVELKGIDVLLRAIALWRPDPFEARFVIGGTGPMLYSYQELAKELKVDHLIEWFGEVSRDQAPALFSACDVFVLPSRHESFGVVYIEALASGKPLIATKCGGPETIVTPENGVLVPIDDLKALSDAMVYMAKNLESFDIGKIRKDFEYRFSQKSVTAQIVAVYDAVINRERA